jgi:hypothetical protein
MGNVPGLACGWIRDCDDLRTVCQVFQLKPVVRRGFGSKGKKGISVIDTLVMQTINIESLWMD